MVVLVSVQYEQWSLETFCILDNGSKGALVLPSAPRLLGLRISTCRQCDGLSGDQWTQSIPSFPAPNPQTNYRIQGAFTATCCLTCRQGSSQQWWFRYWNEYQGRHLHLTCWFILPSQVSESNGGLKQVSFKEIKESSTWNNCVLHIWVWPCTAVRSNNYDVQETSLRNQENKVSLMISRRLCFLDHPSQETLIKWQTVHCDHNAALGFILCYCSELWIDALKTWGVLTSTPSQIPSSPFQFLLNTRSF